MHIVLEVSGFYFIIRNGNSVQIRGRNPLAKVLLVIEHLTLALVPRGISTLRRDACYPSVDRFFILADLIVLCKRK